MSKKRTFKKNSDKVFLSALYLLGSATKHFKTEETTMKLISGYENRKARFEMLPLLDVMFLILVFFIYSIFSMTVHKGLNVDLPTANGSLEIGELSTVTITADKLLYLNKEAMEMDQLAATLIESWNNSQTPVLIKADKLAPMGIGIELLGRLKMGGVERVAFQVKPDE